MLEITEYSASDNKHQFLLSSTIDNTDSTEFVLVSHSYSGLNINLRLQAPTQELYPDYTVSVYLFKNNFHLQHQITDLRIDGLSAHKGKVGYLFRLDALFEKDTVLLTRHTYCYAYLGLQYLFSDKSMWQTKQVAVKDEPYKISDFFDDDTIILVLCNEWANGIPNFNIENYMENLFLYDFISFSRDNPIVSVNRIQYIEDNYIYLPYADREHSEYVLRLREANPIVAKEPFITHMFQNLIQKKWDAPVRFLMLYQVVEIYISNLFVFEIQNKVCKNIFNLDSSKLKETLNDMAKQKSLIESLFNEYAKPAIFLENLVKDAILDFFLHVAHPDYADAKLNDSKTLSDLFYDFRNKLVHQYRILHTPGVDNIQTLQKLRTINAVSEALMAEIITEFKA